MKKLSIALVMGISIFFAACEKSDSIGPNDKNDLSMYFENMVGTEPITLGTKTYTSGAGEDFTITTLNYFISNISIKKRDGTELKFADQYFLVKETDENSKTITLKDVPAGDYSSISFMVGVDSAKSVSDVSQRTGVLDPASYGTDNMYWSWNSGYIFFKMEGTSTKSTGAGNGYKLHIGGFGGMSAKTANNLRTITLPFGTDAAQVRKNIAPEIHLGIDVLKVFGSNVKIADKNEIMNPTLGIPVADNYKNMFDVEHIHNDAM
ncbi:hypothetical protein EGI22_22345 [Lacihabitans sp. LS3-19]|uniref:MbnP family protein n=1 Tax=Lacihabitans sp. LS3-19 TaxID=2487335 RepID=UPI0020CBF13D|nr:MbnP family protein [Lacihabitans sp. LS3-19]MCP9770656.1 hypothetical protein [Lacihabitans sp. LS3-19]